MPTGTAVLRRAAQWVAVNKKSAPGGPRRVPWLGQQPIAQGCPYASAGKLAPGNVASASVNRHKKEDKIAQENLAFYKRLQARPGAPHQADHD
jgi:hypothetical protein